MAGEWRRLSLREAGVMLIDCDHRTPPPTDIGYPYVAIPQLRDGHIDFSGARRITREHYDEWTKRAKPTAHDVVLSRRCNPGETAFVPPSAEFAVGQNLVLLRANGTSIHPPFLRWLVRGPEWWDQIRKFLNVGAAAAEEDDEPFEDKMARLTAQLGEQLAAARRLDAVIRSNLENLGYSLKD